MAQWRNGAMAQWRNGAMAQASHRHGIFVARELESHSTSGMLASFSSSKTE
jgi:hypothetical protein